jgi:hypothetical protein
VLQVGPQVVFVFEPIEGTNKGIGIRWEVVRGKKTRLEIGVSIAAESGVSIAAESGV